MARNIKDRLERLAIDVSNINNFNYAPLCGYSTEKIDGMIRELVEDFPGMYYRSSDTMITVAGTPNSQIGIEKVEEWEKRVKNVFDTLRSDSEYKELLKAYRKNDQDKIRDHLPGVFVDFMRSDIVDGSTLQLFHGVRVPKGIHPKSYLDFCLRIQKEGLKRSPYGLHMDMDYNIRPVFATPNEYDSHGIIYFSFKPKDHTVVLDKNGDEAKIYTPLLKTDLELKLRDADTIPSHGPQELGIRVDRAESYISEVEERLQKKGIAFKKLGLPKK